MRFHALAKPTTKKKKPVKTLTAAGWAQITAAIRQLALPSARVG
jgi:hypothetical protein